MRLPRVPRRRPRRAGRRAALLAAAAVLAALAAVAAGTAGTALAAGRRTARRPAPRRRPRALPRPPGAARSPAAPPARPPSPAPAPARTAALAAGCGVFDVTCHVTSAITGWFAGLVTSAVNPLLGLIGQTALSTPQPGTVPAVQALWQASLGIADACYVLLVLVGGVIVMSHETLQTSYAAKEMAPRIVLGFLAANLSMVLMSKGIDLANGLSAAFAGEGVNPQAAAQSLISTLGTSVTSDGIFIVLLELAGVILALVLAAVYVIRLMAVVLLAAAAPVLLALYALPQTAWAARWWWRALTAALAIQVAQGLVMTAAVRVFFSAGWLPWHVTGGLAHILVTLCLLYVLMRIPFWIARPVLSPFGSSPLRRAARFVFTAAVLSRVAPVLRGTAGAGRGPGAGGTAAARRRTGPGGAPGRAAAGGAGSGRGASGSAAAGAGPRYVQPPLPGMPSPPRPARHTQLALPGMPRTTRPGPGRPRAPAGPAPGRPGVPAAAAARDAVPAAAAPPAHAPPRPAAPAHPAAARRKVTADGL